MSILAQTALLDRAAPAAHVAADVDLRSRMAIGAVAALALVAPFERALIDVPGGVTITTVEAAIAVALTLVAAAVWVGRARLAWPPPVVAATAGLLLVLLTAAAVAAPADQGNALRFAARMWTAAAIVVATATALTTLARAWALTIVIVGAAGLVAAVAVLEALQVGAVMAGLTAFRPGFHVVGGQLRATSTLIYPTIASMYLEVAFALGVWLLMAPSGAGRRRWASVAAFVALAVIGAGITATFTRAGLISMAAALALVAGIRRMRFPPGESRPGRLAALAVVLVAIVSLMHSPELLATRFSTEGAEAWYGARYVVPPTLRLETGRLRTVPITLTNTGRLTWSSTADPAYAVSYHWLRAGSGAVVQYDGLRTPFAVAVAPGATVTVPVAVVAPDAPGAYTLVWDVVLETRAWFSTEGVEPARTPVRVEGAPSGTVRTMMPRLPPSTRRPPRPELWGAALQMARDHPWLGVGPDNYRLQYGRYLGGTRWDERVHANSMYLDVLAGGGVPSLAALAGLLLVSGLVLWRRCLQAPPDRLMPAAAALAAWLVIAVHGLVDSFLSFTPTYLVFSLAAGIAWSPALATRRDADADCL